MILLPVYEIPDPSEQHTKKGNGARPRLRNPIKPSGYQVTVPSLPGLITFGRTLEEARQMAEDAVRVHLEGLQKAGEPIPDERNARREKLRIALAV
jgi:predicted RNase H-like HicB family nuclease